MEKRAREREEKHAIIRERRRQMEEERIRLKQQVGDVNFLRLKYLNRFLLKYLVLTPIILGGIS